MGPPLGDKVVFWGSWSISMLCPPHSHLTQEGAATGPRAQECHGSAKAPPSTGTFQLHVLFNPRERHLVRCSHGTIRDCGEHHRQGTPGSPQSRPGWPGPGPSAEPGGSGAGLGLPGLQLRVVGAAPRGPAHTLTT